MNNYLKLDYYENRIRSKKQTHDNLLLGLLF
jgi:hypothetical protein